MTKDTFAMFLGQEIKAPYRDGSTFKVARGVLEDYDERFIRISGRIGTIIINQKNIEKMSSIKRK